MTTTDPSAVLRVAGATRRYGGLTAVDDVSLELGPGERLGVIGPNGAGKTTLFKLIAGEVALTRGTVRFADRDVTRSSVRRRARFGVARTFQVSSLFGQLSVEENVRLAEQARFGRRWKAWPERRSAGRDDVDRVLEEMLLAGRRRDRVVELSHGERRQLEIAMALVTGPRLLLLDEPAAGLSLRERDRLRQVVESLPRTIPLLLIEHDLSLVFGLADRVICLDHGKLIAAGPPAEVRENARVREVYLGQSTTA